MAFGQTELAAQLLGTYGHQGNEAGTSHPIFDRRAEQLLDQLCDLLGETALDEQLRHGRELTVDQALHLALDTIADLG